MEKFDKANPYNKNVPTPNAKKAAIIMIIAFFLVVFFVIKCSCSNEKVDEKKKYGKSDALMEAEDYVRSKLKAPSTAEFEGGTDGVTQVNDTIFTVVRTVDSQNSFGAMLRANYSCKVIFHSKNDTYSIEDFILE